MRDDPTSNLEIWRESLPPPLPTFHRTSLDPSPVVPPPHFTTGASAGAYDKGHLLLAEEFEQDEVEMVIKASLLHVEQGDSGAASESGRRRALSSFNQPFGASLSEEEMFDLATAASLRDAGPQYGSGGAAGASPGADPIHGNSGKRARIE